MEYELKTLKVFGEWRYTLHEHGWQWGRFASEAEARTAGGKHIEKAMRHGNDWGIPETELKELSSPPWEMTQE